MNNPPENVAPLAPLKGRGAQIQPPNRFERLSLEIDGSGLAADDPLLQEGRHLRTEYYADDTRSVVTENDSPDIGYRYSLNPYRGCSHGCAYCYARPTHEYLGWNAGLDFETRILVKLRAPELFRQWLQRPDWHVEPIVFSGVTDCYQPAERQFRLTRGCLEVALEARQPVSLVTKNALLLRDVDLLRALAEWNLVHVSVSLTTLDAELARVMEPRTSTPAARLRAIQELAEAGIPTSVLVSPLIPGLTDSELPAILQAASAAGAQSAGYTLLRLPGAVRDVFLDWLERTQFHARDRVLSRIRAVRGGKMNDARFGHRLRGEGNIAETITDAFRLFARRWNLDRAPAELATHHFQPPRPASGQLRLF